jgi:hypothetical protein
VCDDESLHHTLDMFWENLGLGTPPASIPAGFHDAGAVILKKIGSCWTKNLTKDQALCLHGISSTTYLVTLKTATCTIHIMSPI